MGRQLASATDASGNVAVYQYDYNGLRTSKTYNNSTTTYVYVNNVLTAQITGNEQLYFRYDSNHELLAFEYDNGNIVESYYYVKNLQGDIIGILDSAGTEVVSYEYDAWGKGLPATGSLASTIGEINPFRYRGYYCDTETGLYYLQSRYYDANIGRFINADDAQILLLNQESSIQHNLFAYCLNNQINRIDKYGYKSRRVNLVLGKMEDKFAKQIVDHWIYGKGKFLKISNDNEWSEYLFANKKLKEKVDKAVKKAINKGESSFGIYNQKLKLSETGDGGYYTGYDLLNGSNAFCGGFSAWGTIRKNKNNEYVINTKCSFNDIVDPNFQYSGDRFYYKVMK